MQLLARKPIADLEPQDGPHSLKRVLGAGDLIMLAIGAVIGAGIFGAIGTAAAGQYDAAGNMVSAGAGPALVFSFLLLGVCCALAGLCYAELASMIPQAGSAYAYTYATLGELVAWMIGWDLILEYAVGNVSLALTDTRRHWQLTGGVLNLFDERYLAQGNASLATLGYAEAIYARPRNWFLQLSVDF